MFIFIASLSAFVQSVVALFVLLKNHKSLTNILFFTLSMFVMVWAVINFLLTEVSYFAANPIAYRALMASVVAQNCFFFLFAHTFPDRSIGLKAGRLRAYLVLSVLTFIAALTPLVFADVDFSSPGSAGVGSPVPGPGMALFMVHAAISIIFGLRVLFSKYRRSAGNSRQQFRFILVGSVILWGIVPVTNFVITLAAKTSFFAQISPIYTLAFSSIIAYAIIRQRLFDIRSAVARSVAYLLSLGFIALLYGAVLVVLGQLLSTGQQLTATQKTIYLGFAVGSAMLYQPVKKFFDKATNRIFYRDAYDPQEFLDELNKQIVGTIEMEQLLKTTAAVIQKTVKTEFCCVVLPASAGTPARIYGSKLPGMAPEAVIALIKDRGLGRQKINVRDQMSASDSTGLFQAMQDSNIGLISELSSKAHGSAHDGIAYIIVGAKKSGNIFTGGDTQVMGIISDELVVAIQNVLRFEEIERFNETLQQKVDDATRKLRQTNLKLKQLNDSKDDFISMASHQLRTPLSSIKGYVSLVMDGDAGKISRQQHDLLQQAFNSSQKMVYLIADLLNVSRLKTGKFAIDRVPTNLAKMLHDELDQLKAEAASRGIELAVRMPADFPTLLLDETKTRQVIMNFLDNAIYYTPSGGHIHAELKNLPTTVEFRVIDDGIGVPAAERHQLFDKFYRAKNAQRARPDGTGLGLYMAKKVVVAQGGAIIFDSIENKGSTFGFSLPKDAAPTENK